MKKAKLRLRQETIRKLTGPELRIVAGGLPTTQGPEPCIPASPYATCTGCTVGSQRPCGTGLCTGDGTYDCTLVTFGDTK